MKILKLLIKSTLIISLLITFCIYYAFKIEPFNLVANEIAINTKTQDTIKIIQFSDTHIKENFSYKNLNKVVDNINKHNPDIVVFTGDLYDNYAKYNDDSNIIKELQHINAKYAKIAVWGNRDHGGGGARAYETIMEQAGFIVLKNENYCITTDTNKQILITGLDERMLGNPILPKTSKLTSANYALLLLHEPDIIDSLDSSLYDLALSGHSHGGQIDIPFIPVINQKAVNATAFSTKYISGLYELNNTTKMYVNTGIGTTHVSARFGVTPEISIFNIYL